LNRSRVNPFAFLPMSIDDSARHECPLGNDATDSESRRANRFAAQRRGRLCISSLNKAEILYGQAELPRPRSGIVEDSDEAGMAVDWSQASVELPQQKATLNMRIDRDVLEFFRRQGKGYQTKINAVLRSYVEQMRHGR
jgi:uncharacterized protein (DUF4415 family)